MKRLSDKLVELLNFRIKAELESAYLYETMANCLQYKGFPNAAKVWRKDAEDERIHAQWAMDYMLIMDVQPTIPTIIAPKEQMYEGIVDVINKTTEHEYLVTKQCNELAKTALLDNDLVTYQFVSSKYLAEQIEEIERCMEMQKYVNQFGDCIDLKIFLEDYFAKKL